MKQCEGACESHVGEVIAVHVETVSGYDWGEFDYCEAAVEEDRRRGLIVTPSNTACSGRRDASERIELTEKEFQALARWWG